MNNEELTGTLVMVNTVLWDDPAERMGQIGVVIDANMHHDEFLVRFDDKGKALYSADALLVLQSPDQLYQLIENRAGTLSPDLLKDLRHLALLQQYGAAKQIRTAFELVQHHTHLEVYGTRPLQEALGMTPNHGPRR